MKPAVTSGRFLLWLPRIVAILFALFLSLFAMDVFQEGKGFLQTFAELLIHLIPSFALVLLILFSWRREWIGAVFFFMLGVFRLIQTNWKFGIMTEVLIAGPLLLISILYAFNWLRRYRTIKTEEPNG